MLIPWVRATTGDENVGRSATTALATVALGVVVVLGGAWFLNNTRPGLEIKCRFLNDAGACLLFVLTEPAQPGSVPVPAPFDPAPAEPATPEPTRDPAIALAAAVQSADQDVQSALSSLRDEISSLGDEPSGIGDDLASMRDDLGTVKEDLATTRSEYNDSSQDSGTICSDAATVSSDVATLEGDLATIESDGASLESTLVSFDQAVDELRGAAASLRSALAAYPAGSSSATADGDISALLDKASKARSSAQGRYTAGLKTAKGYVKQGKALEAKANQVCTAAENAGR
jgi:hypothetical protein